MSTPFLSDWLEIHARRDPDALAIATPDRRLTYGALAARVRELASVLAADGVVPGQRVIVALPNTIASVVADLALHAIGATVVEVNRAWAPDALRTIVERSGARNAIVYSRDARLWRDAAQARGLRFWTVSPDDHRAMDEPGEVAGSIRDDGSVDAEPAGVRELPSWVRRDSDVALILFTSGSTGRPHGVMQTWRNLHANTRSIVEYLRLTSRDSAMLVLPLSYCYGRSVLQTHLFVGGSVVMDNRFMYPRLVLEHAVAQRCTGFAGVPATFEIIRRQVDLEALGTLPFRYVTQAGEAMSIDTIHWARRAFAPAQLFVMYGQTEATARLSYLPPEFAEKKVGSIGVPIPGVELRIVNDEGRELPHGAAGNLVARGDNITRGYLDEPEETAQILRDGWLWTGDLARRDTDGFFYHEGRAREILKIGGHRVSPAEIEAVILGHPDAADAAVTGASDTLLGQVAAAFVVRRRGSDLDETGLRRFCAERVPAFKVPHHVTFVDVLPRNAAGKLLRRELESLGRDKRPLEVRA